ncbi:uncharacterized protein TRUGW13939_05126 [Talaromyces rugulosus]|uniref:Peptidase C13 family protein n=1 Tax=Talaromyces rugulosus TaxID=121627 RepID=A0A7H8QVZ7_TALRU|nr:uncharacterized protein TRUGW13939_05126 [Talaromyces rugulosus]QKX58006.1 hypothetical protein TRUGW13939_05126 [Talaromyces rugulosus]
MSTAKIKPYDIEGLNTVGRVTGTKEDLKDREFMTACPPDVPPRSRIVAVCGITDYKNRASPAKDGFFFSDFYLFHHLLSPGVGVTPQQIWITSEEPRDLIGKYREYVYGDPKGGRRVVLNEDMLQQIQVSGTIRVVQRDQLLERFVSTVREQACLAADADEHLVILIFGHGQWGTYGVHIGHNGRREIPVLHIEDINRALKPNNKVTLFSTACYSGGWLVQPDVNRYRHINTTGIAAAAPTRESISWPVSASVGRAGGSVFAGSILQSLIDLSESPDRHQILEDPTYIELANSVYVAYNKLNPYPEDQGIHFSAQDDTWEKQYEQRVGIPLSRFRERFESLPSIPDGEYQSRFDLDAPEGPVGRLGTLRKRSKVKFWAYTYMKSNPGITEAAPNMSVHGPILQLLHFKKKLSDEQIDCMYRSLEYRLNVMDQANYFAAIMGVKKTNICDFILEGYKLTPEKQKLRSFATDLIYEKQLLNKPRYDAGLEYLKPMHYLAILLAESGMDTDEIKEKIDYAVKVKAEGSKVIVSENGEVLNDPELVGNAKRFSKVTKDLGYRVKGLFQQLGLRS